MKIFVTGSGGFVGSHTVAELTRRGHSVLVLSRRKVALPKGAKLLRGDLSVLGRFERGVKRFKPDAVLHLAWEGLPDHGPEMSFKNLEYGISIVNLAIAAGAKKIVVSGSRWEYGATKGVMKEDAGLCATNAFCGAKNAIHAIGEELSAKHGVDFVWTRIFSAYGPGQKRHSLIPYIMECKRNGLQPVIKTPGATNDHVYVTDVARAFAMILEKHKPSQSRTYNIGSGKLFPVKDIVKAVYGKYDGNSKLQPGYTADISRIKKEIGWKPIVGMKEGLAKTLQYYRSLR